LAILLFILSFSSFPTKERRWKDIWYYYYFHSF
jgi:hypothetical protein